MTDQQILEKAIQKAIDGGWYGRLDKTVISGTWVVAGGLHIKLDGTPPKEVLYDHSFAKALWGEQVIGYNSTPVRDYDRSQPISLEPNYRFSWQYHLQQMVIADDSIKYLGENI